MTQAQIARETTQKAILAQKEKAQRIVDDQIKRLQDMISNSASKGNNEVFWSGELMEQTQSYLVAEDFRFKKREPSGNWFDIGGYTITW